MLIHASLGSVFHVDTVDAYEGTKIKNVASFYRSRENRFSLICDRVRRSLFGLIVVFVLFFLLF